MASIRLTPNPIPCSADGAPAIVLQSHRGSLAPEAGRRFCIDKDKRCTSSCQPLAPKATCFVGVGLPLAGGCNVSVGSTASPGRQCVHNPAIPKPAVVTTNGGSAELVDLPGKVRTAAKTSPLGEVVRVSANLHTLAANVATEVTVSIGRAITTAGTKSTASNHIPSVPVPATAAREGRIAGEVHLHERVRRALLQAPRQSVACTSIRSAITNCLMPAVG